MYFQNGESLSIFLYQGLALSHNAVAENLSERNAGMNGVCLVSLQFADCIFCSSQLSRAALVLLSPHLRMMKIQHAAAGASPEKRLESNIESARPCRHIERERALPPALVAFINQRMIMRPRRGVNNKHRRQKDCHSGEKASVYMYRGSEPDGIITHNGVWRRQIKSALAASMTKRPAAREYGNLLLPLEFKFNKNRCAQKASDGRANNGTHGWHQAGLAAQALSVVRIMSRGLFT